MADFSARLTVNDRTYVPLEEHEAALAALRSCLYAAHGQDAANNAVKRIVTEAFGGQVDEKGKSAE